MSKHHLVSIACSPKARYQSLCVPNEGPREPCDKPYDYPEKPKYDTSVLVATVVYCENGLPVPCAKVKFSCNDKHAKFKYVEVETDAQGVAKSEVTYPHVDYPRDTSKEPTVFTASIAGDSDSVDAPLARENWPPVQLYNATSIPAVPPAVFPNFTINAAQLSQGPFAVITFPPPDANSGPFDVLTFYWDGVPGSAKARIEGDYAYISLTPPGFPEATTFSNGVHTIAYSITEPGNVESPIFPAESQTVTVSGSTAIAPTLLAPTWLPVTVWILNYTTRNNFNIIIPPPALTATDTINVYIDILTRANPPVFVKTVSVTPAAGVAGPQPATGFPVDPESVANLNGYLGRIYYTVTTAGVTSTSNIRPINIDTVPPGGGLEILDDCDYRDDGYDHDDDYDHKPRKSRY